MNAFDDLTEFLEEGEEIESLVFGEWGWDGYGGDRYKGYPFIPSEKIGILMSIEEAKPLMNGWSFDNGFGAPMCYSARIWTNKRVIWVTQYDGSTNLDSAPRNPIAHIPGMPGG